MLEVSEVSVLVLQQKIEVKRLRCDDRPYIGIVVVCSIPDRAKPQSAQNIVDEYPKLALLFS